MLPILQKQNGKKILIEDNLSSHLNIEVFRPRLANNISFVALPPNATHLMQPLDVAYFRSMKGKCRKVLESWKNTTYGSCCFTIPKDQFPSLLKTVVENLSTSDAENLKSGFIKCGLFH